MTDYAIEVFWSDADKEWITAVPNLKGCSASSATPEEAVREVQIAKELWIEVARENNKALPDSKYLPNSRHSQAV